MGEVALIPIEGIGDSDTVRGVEGDNPIVDYLLDFDGESLIEFT